MFALSNRYYFFMEEIYLIFERNMRLGTVPYRIGQIGYFDSEEEAKAYLTSEGFKETEIHGTFMDVKNNIRLTVNKVQKHISMEE